MKLLTTAFLRAIGLLLIFSSFKYIPTVIFFYNSIEYNTFDLTYRSILFIIIGLFFIYKPSYILKFIKIEFPRIDIDSETIKIVNQCIIILISLYYFILGLEGIIYVVKLFIEETSIYSSPWYFSLEHLLALFLSITLILNSRKLSKYFYNKDYE